MRHEERSFDETIRMLANNIRVRYNFNSFGAVAQLEARLNGIEKVRGSNPLSSIPLSQRSETMDEHFRRSIVWFRRDLRLHDNPSLWNAVQESKEVIPIYIRDHPNSSPYSLSPGKRRLIEECLRALDRQLDACGARLVVLSGEPTELFTMIKKILPFEAIYSQEHVEPNQIALEARVLTWARENGVRMISSDGLTVHRVREVLKPSGEPYTLFSPFYRIWSGLQISQPLPSPHNIPSPVNLAKIMGDDIPTPVNAAANEAGEMSALKTMDVFFEKKLDKYPSYRDHPCIDGTSRLSAFLNLGAISPRLVAWRCVKEQNGAMDGAISPAAVFLRQIAWRDFYYSILRHFPDVLSSDFKRRRKTILWENDQTLIEAWRRGETGYPIVDAGMRQLLQEGWMHNRVRMITASFLTKSLLTDWRIGEKHFMDHLTDGDISCNNGGWQWAASTGTDAQPWFRIFNPTLQGKKFDPNGSYVKRYLPELNQIPSPLIHQPWVMTHDDQTKYGVILGRTYPFPIVDHAFQKERYLYMMRSNDKQ